MDRYDYIYIYRYHFNTCQTIHFSFLYGEHIIAIFPFFSILSYRINFKTRRWSFRIFVTNIIRSIAKWYILLAFCLAKFRWWNAFFLNIYSSRRNERQESRLSIGQWSRESENAELGPLLEPITGTLFICTASSCHGSWTMGLLESTAIDDPFFPSFSTVLFPPGEWRIFRCASFN